VATDIAFALGALSLAGNRVPVSLKILLTALAIIDDLGAILVIALFYAHGFSVFYFVIAMTVFVALVALNRLNVNNLFCYVAGGVVMWFFMLHSGVHPTISGVLLAFAIPFREGDALSPSYKMQHRLDKPVPFFILPLFALANTAIIFPPGWYLGFQDSNTVGIVMGLVLGKPIGILLFSFIGVTCGLCKLPHDLTWRHITAIGILAGIGFTMSIFIANLAFGSEILVENSKIAILFASALAGTVGLSFLFSMRHVPLLRGDG
jgi:NhaA family Na+:H+ antiporter